MAQAEEGSSSNGPHRMRITSGGQVSGYVNFALTFLKENPSRALVLHTLPPTPTAPGSTEGSSSSNATGTGMGASLLATPKLVSVVEKIKREYMASLNTNADGKGKNKAVGIWQYTESGTLPGSTEHEYGLDSVLEGKTKPKLKHRPFLQVTLSTRPLGLEEGSKGRNVTCQYVMARRKKTKQGKGKLNGGAEAATPTSTSTDIREEGESQAAEPAVDGTDSGKGAGTGTGNKIKTADKDKGVKRKSESSQSGPGGAAQGGKKRKK